MLTKNSLWLSLVLGFAIFASSMPTSADPLSSATDFSSAQKGGGKGKGGGGGGKGGGHSGPKFSAGPKMKSSGGSHAFRQGGPKISRAPKTFKSFSSKGPASNPLKQAAPAGEKKITTAKLKGIAPQGAKTVIRGRNFSVWRDNYRIRYHGGWRRFAALSTLGALAIGAGYLYPYAYISAPRYYCDGFTEDGCQLTWRNVETIEGDVIGQCVAYCPWQ